MKFDIGTYDKPTKVGYKGWMSTSNALVFIGLDDELYIFNGRDTKGAVKENGIKIPKEF